MGRKRSSRHAESHANRLREIRKINRQYGEIDFPINLEKPPTPSIFSETDNIKTGEQLIFQTETHQEFQELPESYIQSELIEPHQNPQERK